MPKAPTKKRRRPRYRDLINSVVSTTIEDRKKAAEEHKKNIQQSTGGGHFSKIDRI